MANPTHPLEPISQRVYELSVYELMIEIALKILLAFAITRTKKIAPYNTVHQTIFNGDMLSCTIINHCQHVCIWNMVMIITSFLSINLVSEVWYSILRYIVMVRYLQFPVKHFMQSSVLNKSLVARKSLHTRWRNLKKNLSSQGRNWIIIYDSEIYEMNRPTGLP